MKLYNATGHPLYLYRKEPLRETPRLMLSIFPTLVPDPEHDLRDTGVCVGIKVNEDLVDVPLMLVRYSGIRQIPAQQEGVGYIVDGEIAHAGSELGRTDFYIPVDYEPSHQGKGIGFRKLGRLA